MKRLIFTLLVCALMATPAFATATLDLVSPHLGWWAEGHPRSTHQYWDFTADVNPDGALHDWEATPPTEKDNPGTTVALIVADSYTGTSFTDPTSIGVLLQIANIQDPLAYKELWVHVGFTGELVEPGVLGSGSEPSYSWTYLGSGGPSGVAEFGFKIFPNPDKEDVWFTILAPATGGLAVLDWIHVDTICIPAPGAIILGSIGVGLVGWLRRRKSL